MSPRGIAIALTFALVCAGPIRALADEPGVTPTEVKIGQTASYSGPASPAIGQAKVQVAYFNMVNDKGGINGRKINLISVDDGFAPAKSVEQTRKLVEEDKVFLMFGQMGTAAAAASSKYLNAKAIPQLLVGSGASRFADPTNYPWTIGMAASYRGEAVLFGRYIREKMPSAKIGILYENDDLGKDYVSGLAEGLADNATSAVVAKQSLDVTEPTVDSQILNLRASGADILLVAAISKPTAQAIRKIGELGWKPQIFVSLAASSIKTVMEPAGLENSKGIITTTVYKDPSDPRWKADPEYVEYIEFMNKYMPGFDQTDLYAVSGYIAAQVLEKALRDAGPNLTRAAVRDAMTHVNDFHARMASPKTLFTITPTDYDMFKSLQFMRFNGTAFEPMDVSLD